MGHGHVPVVIADLSHLQNIRPAHLFAFGYHYSVPLDKWNISDSAADYLYLGKNTLDFELPGTLRIIQDFEDNGTVRIMDERSVPLIKSREQLSLFNPENVFFIEHQAEDPDVEYLTHYPNCIIVLDSKYSNKTQLYRYFNLNIAEKGIINPVILRNQLSNTDPEEFQLWSASDLGVSFIDGFGDGIWLRGEVSAQLINATAFGILQATRLRISKTEYISCPSCGRTLFDLQETTAKIRAKTSHLKGLKIGIMGCIVNGPGEMADADYGYVGTGPGKIHLYKEKTIIKKNVPEDEAVNELIELIKSYGDWVEPVK